MVQHPKLSLFVLAILYTGGNSVHAAGFALSTQSGSGTGNAFAGAAVVIEDASSAWFNPATMPSLPTGTHFGASAHFISPKAEFTNQGSWINPSLAGGNFDLAQSSLQGRNADGGNSAIVPTAYAVRSLNDRMSVGIAINVPFGLGTEYDEDWYGRYNAVSSDITTININPSIGYQVTDQFSIGAGISAQYMEVELTSAVDSAAVCRSIAAQANSGDLLAQCLSILPNLGDPATDTQVKIKGDDISLGFNIGAMYQATPATRIGMSYRSGVKHDLEGSADYRVNDRLQPVLAATGVTRFNNADVTAKASLPSHVSLSAAHQVNDRLELMADFTRTHWSSFDRLTVKNAETGELVTDANQGWRDSNRYAIGASYQMNDRLKLRTGLALDKTPVPSAQLRTPRTPDNDRTWLALGANYQINKSMSLDVGYARLFSDETPIDNTNEDNGYAIRGLYNTGVDIISAQFNWSF